MRQLKAKIRIHNHGGISVAPPVKRWQLKLTMMDRDREKEITKDESEDFQKHLRERKVLNNKKRKNVMHMKLTLISRD